MALGGIIAASPWTAEYFIERFQLAATRGRLRAEYEFACRQIESNGEPLQQLSAGSQRVFQKIRPSVVSIQASGESGFFDPASQGSGVVVSDDGDIVTNFHVVDQATAIWVEMEGRRPMRAVVVGVDELTDLALLKVDARNLIAAEWGDSDRLQIGSMVWAVGSPYGFQNSITQGIVSSTERRGDSSYQEFLQTDAAVNPGNSGGPLVDGAGRVVGINTLIYGKQFQGISFAVPANLAREICQVLKRKGRVDRGFLGVLPETLLNEDAARLGLDSTMGALLRRITPGTPAAEAGLRENDVIREFNGKPVTNAQSLFRHVGLSEPNTTARVRFIRDGVERSVQVSLGTLDRGELGRRVRPSPLIDPSR